MPSVSVYIQAFRSRVSSTDRCIKGMSTQHWIAVHLSDNTHVKASGNCGRASIFLHSENNE